MGSNIYRRLILYIFSIALSAFDSLAQPVANFTILAPVPNCNPAIYSFANLSSGGLAPLTYKWNFGVYPGVNSVLQNPSTTYLNCGTYSIQLIVTDAAGAKDTATQSVTIYCSPTPDYIVSNISGCIPFNAQFTSTSTPGSGIITDYTWDFGDGYSGSGANPTHTYTDPGCKDLTLIVTNSFNCVADTTIASSLCVFVPPAANFISSVSTACDTPFVVSYSDASTFGLAPYTYQWIFNGGVANSDTIANPVVTYNASGNYSTTLIITDVNGCTDTVTMNNYVTIANNTAAINLSNIQGCVPFTFTADAVPSANPFGYSWTITPTGTISNSNSQNTSVTITDTGTFTICVDIDYGGGCIASSCTTVTTHAAPNAFYTIDGLTATCLRPNPIVFVDSSSGSNLTYSWNFSGGIPSSDNSSTPDTINYVACGTYSTSLTVTDDYGCTSTYSTPNFLTITCPVADFSVSPNNGCVPVTSFFNPDSSTGTPVQWEWSFGDTASGAANFSTLQYPNHTYANQGCYTVTLITTTAQGCKDTMTMVDAVCCSILPSVNFTATPLQNCANMPIFFTDLSTGTFPYTTYTWDFHGVPAYNNESNQQNPSYIYEDTGFFDVTLIVSNYGCNDTLTIDQMVYLFPPVAIINIIRNCANPYTVTFVGSNSLGAQTYLWTIPGGTPSTSTASSVSVTYPTTGIKTVTLFVANDSTGCNDQTNLSFRIRDVEAYFTGTPLTGCSPLNSCMTNTSVDAASYAWAVYNSAGTTIATSTMQNPCFNLTIPGDYSVRLIATDQFGCKDTLYKPNYLTVWGPTSDFVATPLIGCVPLFVSFTDLSSASNSTIVSWQWNFGDPASGALNTSTLQNPTHTYNQAGIFTVKLTVTDNHGCTKLKKKINYIQAVQPVAAFSLADTTVCVGTSACFINASTGTGLLYQWNFGDGNFSTLANPCNTYFTNGNYDITLSIIDATGCVDTTIAYSYVNVTKPVANLIADTTNTSCPPLTVHFTNLSTSIDPSTTYLWQFGDGQVSSNPNPSHIYNIAGTFDVTLIVTNQNGCKDTIVFDDYIVIGGPQAFISQLPTSGCVSHYTCFAAVSPSTISFIWNYGDGVVEVGGDSMCHTYTHTGTFYSELILNDGVGCIYSMPVGVVNVTGANCYFLTDQPQLCDNGIVNFTDSSYGTSPAVSWSWNFGDAASGAQNISTLQNPSHFYSSPGTYITTLNIVTADGCVNSALDSVVVGESPDANFSVSDTIVCVPDTIYFSDLSTSDSAITSWSWNFGDPASGAANTDTAQNPLHYFSTSGTFIITLTITAANGCTNSYSSSVVVNPLPIISFTDADLTCGLLNGMVNAIATVGASPFNYAWSNGATSQSISNLSVGNYFVTVTDAQGCTAVSNDSIQNIPPPVSSGVMTNSSCALLNGAIDLTVSAGTTPYTYAWSNGASTQDILNLAAGNYFVTVTDNSGCINIDSFTITTTALPVLAMTMTHSNCGNADGAVDLTITGGNYPLTILWSNGATTEDLIGVYAGSYSVTVTDSLGCIVTAAINVIDNLGPEMTAYANNASCLNNDGDMYLDIAGGTFPFTYLWSTGDTTATISGLSAGTYSCTVTDALGCMAVATADVFAAGTPVATSVITNATCNNANGQVNLSVTGGGLPYTYVWSNGATTQDLSNVLAGNYMVTVTDGNGCAIVDSNVVANNAGPSLSTSVTNATCSNANGIINLSIVGGTAPFTFIWSNGATTQNLNSVLAGNYFVTITDQNTCTATANAIVTTTLPPAISLTTQSENCNLSNGNVSLNIISGIGPFSFAWSNGATTQNLSSVVAGIYSVTVTDSTGCSAIASATVGNISGPSITSVITQPICLLPFGTISLTASGGVAPYNFSWSNSETTSTIVSLLPANYFVTVTDSAGCQITDSFTIQNLIPITLNIDSTQNICEGTSAIINVSGAFSYVWNPAVTPLNAGASSVSVSPLVTTTYSVHGTDLNGCTADTQVEVIVHAVPTVTVNTASVCAGANAILIAQGATIYSWISPASTNDSITVNPISVSSYTVIGTTGMCSDTAIAVVNILPSPILLVTSATICEGNSATLTASGATGYLWQSGATTDSISVSPLINSSYTVIGDNGMCTDTAIATVIVNPIPIVTVTSDTICDGAFATLTASGATNYLWSTNAIGNSISVNPNSSTTYSVIGTSLGCSDSAIANVIVNPLPNISVVSNSVFICSGATVQLDASGASSYSWSPSAGLSSTNSASVIATLISSATYTVTGIDSNGCANTNSIPVNVQLPLTITTSSSDTIICFGASVDLTVTGNYNYTWSPSTALSATTGNTVTASPTSDMIYTVTGTDVNGCSASIIITVRVNPLPIVDAQSSSTTLCTSSSATLTATGAQNYFWSPSTGLSATTGNNISATPISNITYSVTGVDSFGCFSSDTVSISLIPAPTINISATNATVCSGASTTLTASGANSYSWSPSLNLNSSTGNSVVAHLLSTTTLTVTAIDSNGCSNTATSVVTVLPLPTLIVSAIDSTICFGTSTTLNASGAATYEWSPSTGLSATTGNSVTANPTTNITYQVKGFDANGCQAIANVNVYVNNLPAVVIPTNPAICPGDFVTIVATGAQFYHWSNNALGDSILVNPIVNSTYSVVGTDANGCSASDTAIVTINPLPVISVSASQNNFCKGQTTVLTASGAVNYLWSPATTLNSSTGNSVIATPQSNTTYTVVGTNAQGCTHDTSIAINILSLPAAAAGPDADICLNESVQLMASGGNSFSWSPTIGLDNPFVANPMASPSSTTAYIVSIGNPNGCYATDTILITVHLAPVVDAGIAQIICFPNTTQLNGTGADFYSWIPSDFLNDSTLQSPVCSPLADITYTLMGSDSFGCKSSDTVSVKILKSFTITANPDEMICINDEVQLLASGGNNYSWSPASSLDNALVANPIASPTETTTYIVYSTDGVCFDSQDSVVVTVHKSPMIFAGADAEIMYGSTYQLSAFTNGGNILWTPADNLSCNTCPDPIVNHLDAPTTYYLQVTDSAGCRSEDSVRITLVCDQDLVFVPNAFTPNDDNKNDVFRIRTYGLSKLNYFRVFNRWGEMVFETTDVSKGWDGTWKGQPCTPAVFVYYIDGACANGSEILKQGNVTLIR